MNTNGAPENVYFYFYSTTVKALGTVVIIIVIIITIILRNLLPIIIKTGTTPATQTPG